MQITGLARNAAPGKQMDANQWSIENESMGAPVSAPKMDSVTNP
jgi:hypothetical protein